MINVTTLRENTIGIRPVTQDDVEAVLNVYQQCEDFLALGPVPTASIEMVVKDIEVSQRQGGVFCGIYTADEKMVGVVDYIPNHYEGDPQTAFLSLLMIAMPFRNQGIGQAVLYAIEDEIKKDAAVTTILSGVQVNNPQAIHFWQRNGYHIIAGAKLMPDQTSVFDLRKEFN